MEQTSDVAQLGRLLQGNRAKQDALFQQLAACFDARDLAAAKDLATQLIYQDRLQQAIRDKMP